LWDIAKAMLRGKFVAFTAFIGNQNDFKPIVEASTERGEENKPKTCRNRIF
jgi:hypothetical protein